MKIFWLPSVNIFAPTLACKMKALITTMSFLRFMPVSDCVQERPVLIFQEMQAVQHYQYHRHLCPHPGFAICLERDFLWYFIYFSFHKILLWYTRPATEVQNTNISSFHYPQHTPVRDGGGGSCWSLSHLSQQLLCEEQGFLWQA